MDFKKLAQDKLDKISGFKSNTNESEFDDILEGLDLEIESVKKLDESEIDVELDDELDFEPVSKSNDQQVQNLFDGYIGEKNFIPNPYEYGPNATYRNLNEGIVYKKNEQNLWESFIKDGKTGQQGPRGFAAGGGTGVVEVQKIATEQVNKKIPNEYGIRSIGSSTGEQGGVGLYELPTYDNKYRIQGYACSVGGIGMRLSDTSLPHLYNHCIGSTRVSTGSNNHIQQFNEMKIYRPSHVQFFCGANDLYDGTLAIDIWDHVRFMVDECLEWGAIAIIFIPFIRPNGVTQSIRIQALQYRNLIINYCKNNSKNVYYIDMLQLIATPNNSSLTNKPQSIETGGYHVSLKGAAIVGDAVSKLYEKLAPKNEWIFPLVGYDVTSTSGVELLINPQLSAVNTSSVPTGWLSQGAAMNITNEIIPADNGHYIYRATVSASTSANTFNFIQSSACARMNNGQSATAGIQFRIMSGGENIRSIASYIDLGQSGGQASMFQNATGTESAPIDVLNGKTLYCRTGPFLKIVDSVLQTTFGTYVYFNNPGTIIIEFEAPFIQLIN